MSTPSSVTGPSNRRLLFAITSLIGSVAVPRKSSVPRQSSSYTFTTTLANLGDLILKSVRVPNSGFKVLGHVLVRFVTVFCPVSCCANNAIGHERAVDEGSAPRLSAHCFQSFTHTHTHTHTHIEERERDRELCFFFSCVPSER